MKTSSLLRRQQQSRPKRGFALIVTLSLMILLTVIAVGLLSLSSISLRSTGAMAASNVARANARMALMLALGELQKTAGPDQRITADRSIYLPVPTPGTIDVTPNKSVVGVWESWSPKISEGQAPPTGNNSYTNKKTNNFKGWLTSTTNPTDLATTGWATGDGIPPNPVDLFTVASDGYAQSGSNVNVNLLPPNGQGNKAKQFSGGIAWTVVQEGTKAKINVAGPEKANIKDPNDGLQAQSRPYLVGSTNLKNPDSDWDARARKIIDPAQVKLDPTLWQGGANSVMENSDYTTTSMGLLTDTVWGGLKTDINLGFDMADGDFNTPAWGSSPSYKNPFYAAGLHGIAPLPVFNKQKPMFRPVTANGSTAVALNFRAANGTFQFPASMVPTFTTLRSYYKTPNYVYSTADGPTIFERAMDNIAVVKSENAVNSTFPYPGAPPKGSFTQTGYRPILDRVMYVLSMGVNPADNDIRLIMTPVVTMWNPYNVALEIEGAVACPWLDMPFNITWTFSPSKSGDPGGQAMSRVMANSDNATAEGRQIKPYFYAAITPDGTPNIAGKSIRFKPGEVRVFAPASATDVPYITTAPTNQALPVGQTVYLKPVTSATDMRNLRGGLSIPMKNSKTGTGFVRPVLDTDKVQVVFEKNAGSDYPFAVTLEDANRLKFPAQNVRGQAITDVQMVAFATSGSVERLTSALLPAAQLKISRQPFGVIETYHRVAKETKTARRSDIVYTINPRQPFVNRSLSDGNFLTAPHYETVVRSASSFGDILQTDETGRDSFYGKANARPDGYSQLAFFEAPQQSLISLAAFQHADLAGTPFSTSYQIGNSWASPYLDKSRAFNSTTGASPTGEASYSRSQMGIYDYSYLANEALWDSFFCSSVTPTFQPASTAGNPNTWLGTGIARKSIEAKDVLANFIDEPSKNPLRNSRMKFYAGKYASQEDLGVLKADLMRPEGCVKIAAHLQVDGAFNINSTSTKAWIAVLSGMRNGGFNVRADNGSIGTESSNGKTAFPRMRYPMGTDANYWQGYRSLSDSDIALLADKIVAQIRLRGPFLSLGEFVNRRVDTSNYAYKGALQAAIDAVSTINKPVTDSCDSFDPTLYPFRANVSNPNNTPNIGMGIPGYLTQADLLQSIAPTITPRSDTFTIRAYGEAKDGSGNVVATARCEAVVQRVPEFVDETNPPEAIDLNDTNKTFGRKFTIVSFRYLSKNEVKPTDT